LHGAHAPHLIFLEFALDPDSKLEPGVHLEPEVSEILHDSSQEDDCKRHPEPLRSWKRERDEHVGEILDPEPCIKLALPHWELHNSSNRVVLLAHASQLSGLHQQNQDRA
jgi:hypothetical protein